MSPICQDCHHPCREGEATSSEGWRRRDPLCCLCFRRRYPHLIGTTLAEWHLGDSGAAVTRETGFPDPERPELVDLTSRSER